MIVYFENRWGDLCKVGRFKEKHKSNKEIWDEAMGLITAFCDRRGYKIPYVRVWTTNLGHDEASQIDVGSHTEFFYTVPCLDLQAQVEN